MARRTDGGRPDVPRSFPTRRFRNRRTLPMVALGAMAVGTAGLLVMLPAVSNACQVAPDTALVPADRVRDAIAPGSDVLIVGDSYTKGSGSTRSEHGWAQDIVTDLGWDATIDGLGGTGYVNTGTYGSSRVTFSARIAAHRDLDPELVLVQGSQNDWLVGTDQLRTTVESTLREAERQWPDAVIVAIGPSAPQPRAEVTGGISSAVAAGAKAAGVTYIDPLERQWFTTMNSPGFAASDGQHLNDVGYQYLADKVADALDDLAAPSDEPQCL
ncbi:SGNH/GDSL hydrolase family protein [Curtobacterium sp. 1544]|uniref:SGNH/GDSL hydrolase family protein n=1 Tax=Curtobacterium sp. 1544 TaxID=3156417 RepID=UPI003390E0BB